MNKGRLIFCSGGCRSGKSAQALRLAEGLAGRADNAPAAGLVFVATLDVRDAEMRARVERHRLERGAGWQTLEIPVDKAPDLAAHLDRALRLGRVLVLDCLSTWVGACLESLPQRPPGGCRELEEAILARLAEALDLLAQAGARCVLVSAETGLGLVPESKDGRAFRDVLGRVNQLAAARADEAWFMVSGLPLRLK
ncbi:MAG: bifunctional adenosylcobinamide kinase/adenosylcobinamide-phosphate guanylyltransferase [Deltaproteobacteria bacterium]|jgi:adenosylcobinamide kinase/adenosylcobinamide-phosphate guanylyltransferase|nr:bifunctional adenosylcobinamide kinase/adenosylcobinamide-phosphate guanylyltransferase [Deltaproteobacteria bacterium]